MRSMSSGLNVGAPSPPLGPRPAGSVIRSSGRAGPSPGTTGTATGTSAQPAGTAVTGSVVSSKSSALSRRSAALKAAPPKLINSSSAAAAPTSPSGAGSKGAAGSAHPTFTRSDADVFVQSPPAEGRPLKASARHGSLVDLLAAVSVSKREMRVSEAGKPQHRSGGSTTSSSGSAGAGSRATASAPSAAARPAASKPRPTSKLLALSPSVPKCLQRDASEW